MNAVDKIKLIALEWCMESGMRYNDALYYVLHVQRFVDRIHFECIDSDADMQAVWEFDVAFNREYAEYCAKMIAADPNKVTS